MLKRIFKDIDIKEFIGLMLLFSGLVVYAIYFPETVELDNTELIRVTLTDNPNYDEDAETGYDYFTLRAERIKREFLIKHWVLNNRTRRSINEIKREDELLVLIEKSEMNGNFIKSGSNSIHILGIRKHSKEWIFSLSDYNQGKSDRWKEYLFFGLFFGILLLPRLIRKLRRLIKNEPELITEIKTNEDYG